MMMKGFIGCCSPGGCCSCNAGDGDYTNHRPYSYSHNQQHLGDDEDDPERCGCVCYASSSRQQPCCFCRYPNAKKERHLVLLVIAAQIIMFLGLLCSGFVLMDCRLVYVKSSNALTSFLAGMFHADDPRSHVTHNPSNFTGLGLFFFEDYDAYCAFDVPKYNSDGISSNGDLYHAFTQGWEGPRVSACVATSLALVATVWLASWACCAQVRLARLTWACWVLGLVTLTQCATLFVLRTEFCKENECYFGRTAGFCCCAMVCWVTSTVLVWKCCRNYTVEEWHHSLVLARQQRQQQRPGDDEVEMTPLGRDGANDNGNHRSASTGDDGHHNGETDGNTGQSPDDDNSPTRRRQLEHNGVGDALEVPIDERMVPAVMLGAAGGGDESEASFSAAKGAIILGGG